MPPLRIELGFFRSAVQCENHYTTGDIQKIIFEERDLGAEYQNSEKRIIASDLCKASILTSVTLESAHISGLFWTKLQGNHARCTGTQSSMERVNGED